MGGFLLAKREYNLNLDETEKQIRDSICVFEKKGLALNKKVFTHDFVIYIFNKFQSKTQNIMSFDNGDFILATGTMFYNGKTGEWALKDLYNDFSAEKQEFLCRLLGAYCLIISKEKRLYLVNSLTGLYRVYSDESRSVISTSFLAVFKSLKERDINVQEFYEYLFDGAWYGDKTLVRGIELIDTQSILQLSPIKSAIPKSLNFKILASDTRFDELVKECAKSLVDYYSIIKSNFGNSVCAGLTAGMDTRLMLACMKHVGIKPYLYVYGCGDESNVRIAKMIAAGEGLSLDHEDKSTYPRVKKDEFPGFLEKQYYMIDGLGDDGIFDNGSDLTTRFKRISRAQLQLNGVEGLLRIYLALPNKATSVKSILEAKYNRGDYSMCLNGHFNKRMYFLNLAQKIQKILNSSNDRIDRMEAEMLLPLLRTKYSNGFNHMINTQLADALCPCTEPRFIYLTRDIPYEYKYLGISQAAIIRAIDPVLAKYPSQYGFNFYDYDKIPVRVKIKNSLKFHTPTMLRPYIRAHFLDQQNKGKLPYYLTKDYLGTVFSASELFVSAYINLDKVVDCDMLSRVLSVELLITDKF